MKPDLNRLNHRPTPSPSKVEVTDRPDNGSRSSKGSGPSSGSKNDNPHHEIKHATHAR